MENWPIETTGFLTGAIFIVAAVIMMAFPPRKINALYGYRTRTSMKSQQHWDFAQRYSSRRMIEAGLAMIILAAIIDFVGISPAVGTMISLSLLGLTAVYLLLCTERALNKKFPE